jgi:hypothetical protein
LSFALRIFPAFSEVKNFFLPKKLDKKSLIWYSKHHWRNGLPFARLALSLKHRYRFFRRKESTGNKKIPAAGCVDLPEEPVVGFTLPEGQPKDTKSSAEI